jgi:hypothetical protein
MSNRRTMITRAMFAAATVLATTTPAFAGHVIVYDPRTDAYATSMAHQGPNVQASSYRVINGVGDPYYTQQGPGGSVAGGGSVAASWSQVSQPGGSGNVSFGNAAYSAADLASGLLKATTQSYGPDNFGSPLGFAQSRLDDTIFFTNNSGSTQTISFTYRFDGQLYNPYGSNPGGSVSLGLSCGGNSGACYNGANGTGQAITFADANGNPLSLYGGLRMPEDSWNYYFNASGSCFGENIYCGQYSSSLWDYGLNAPDAGGVVDGYIRAYLNIPTGDTSLGVRGTLNLDCRGASSCDFGHTGTFGFGALPTGVSFGSASGVFLTQSATPAGVPEPATWMTMILGFGLIGGMVRRRQRQAAFA